MNRTIKTMAASLAFVPLPLALLDWYGVLQIKALSVVVMIFYLPPVALASAIRTFHVSGGIFLSATLILMVLWSLLIAMVFWKMASACLAEDAPNRKFDWIGFQVRFFCGAVLGALLGWRAWINLYRGKGDGPSHPGLALAICMAAGAVIVGVVVGLGYRDNFWSRPL